MLTQENNPMKQLQDTLYRVFFGIYALSSVSLAY